MVRKCLVCKVTQKPGNSSRSFHKIPADSHRKQQWIDLLNIKPTNRMSLFVCSDHFLKTDFEFLEEDFTNSTLLRKSALPQRVPDVPVEKTNKACPRISVFDFEKEKKLLIEATQSSDHSNGDNLVLRISNFSYLEPIPQIQQLPSSELLSNRNIASEIASESVPTLKRTENIDTSRYINDSDEDTLSASSTEYQYDKDIVDSVVQVSSAVSNSDIRGQSTSLKVLQPESKLHKYCVVPRCRSTWTKTPKKFFICLPLKKKTRTDWLTLAGHGPKCLSTNSQLYFCADHFDMPSDVENYLNNIAMEPVPQQMRLKPGVMPSKFDCLAGAGRHKCNCISYDSERSDNTIPVIPKQVQPFQNRWNRTPIAHPPISRTRTQFPRAIKTQVNKLNSSDFSTPEQRKAHVKLIRQTLKYKRSTIYSLKISINNLRNNIRFMERRLNHQT